MLSCHLMGGLGNQLFQIFATMSFGIKYRKRILLPYSKSLTTGVERPTYWDTLFSEIKSLTTYNEENPILARQHTNYIMNTMKNIKEHGFKHDASVACHIENMYDIDYCLKGYFQTPKYFSENCENIMNTLKFREKKEVVKTKYFTASDKTSVSLHFRLGDYLEKQEYHNILSIKYYCAAIQKIIECVGDNLKVTCFFEEGDRERIKLSIAVLQKRFPNLEFLEINTEIPDWEQMLYMSACDHNIIANSSFSWWGAFLNENPSKIVCCPFTWFGPAMHYNEMSDLIPSEWNRIEN
jgi:hypothetical protein